MRTTLLVAFAIATVAVISLVAQPVSTPAIPAFPQYLTFGMIGVASGQTARVNALGLPMGGPIIANAACQVTMQFFDEGGKSLGSLTQPVIGGQSVHFDLKRGDIDADTDRREIRATVRTNFVTPNPTPVPFGIGCSVLPTMEIFNQDTGRTMTTVSQTQTLSLILPLLTPGGGQ